MLQSPFALENSVKETQVDVYRVVRSGRPHHRGVDQAHDGRRKGQELHGRHQLGVDQAALVQRGRQERDRGRGLTKKHMGIGERGGGVTVRHPMGNSGGDNDRDSDSHEGSTRNASGNDR